jgi:hypothetical protein
VRGRFVCLGAKQIQWGGCRGRPQFQAVAVKFNLKSNLNRFKIDSNHSIFDRLKNGLPELKNFELKSNFEDLKKLNNFLRRIFIRFRMHFK